MGGCRELAASRAELGASKRREDAAHSAVEHAHSAVAGQLEAARLEAEVNNSTCIPSADLGCKVGLILLCDSVNVI